MRCIINCPDERSQWVRKFFPGIQPYFLNFGNKPYLEFLIDYCVLSEVKEIRIISDNPSPAVYDLLGDGEKWGVHISFGVNSPDDTINDIVKKNKSFCKNDDLIIISGYIWLDYDKNKFAKINIDQYNIGGKFFNDKDCFIVAGKETLNLLPDDLSGIDSSLCNIDIYQIDSILAFYEENMRIVHEENNDYYLPGYGDHSTFIIGRDVEIPRSTEIIKPIILGNCIQLGKGTIVGTGVIIGDNVVVDDYATIKNSIIMGNTYIGCHSEIEDKIIYRNYVIDPKKGVSIDIIDEFLLTQLVKDGYWICTFKQKIFALALLILLFIPFVILRPLITIKSTAVDCYMNQQRKRKLKLQLYITPAKGLAGRWFRKLSLDKYHLLPLVLTGQLRLIGSYILQVSPENEQSLTQFPDYAPGIFSYSEFLGHDKDPAQRQMDELYYMYHASFRLNIKILSGIFLRNVMKHFG